MKTISVTTLATCLSAASLSAAEKETVNTAPYFNQGDWVVSLSGSFNHFSIKSDDFSESANIAIAKVDVSYFLTNNISVGIAPFALALPEEEDEKLKGFGNFAVGLEPNIRYHFQQFERFVPYVGVHAGYAFGVNDSDNSEYLITLGVHAGLQMPLRENVFLDAQLKWTDYSFSNSAEKDNIGVQSLRLLFGIKFKF